MSIKEAGIEHKRFEEALVATTRFVLKERHDLPGILDELAQDIPAEAIAGPPFCILQFVSSVTEGDDAEAGFPVTQEVHAGRVKTRTLPAMEVLSLVHRGPPEELNKSYRKLYGTAYSHGIISDEFCREVYLNRDDPLGGEIELQFVIHDWQALFSENLARALGAGAAEAVTQGGERLTLESIVDERFRWVKGAMERLVDLADEGQAYDVLSSCAHVFPEGQIAKLRTAYEDARTGVNDPWQAVDAVLDFMEADPGWGERPHRAGNVITATKAPRDRQAYEKAGTDAERRNAYCFCPLVRNHLDGSMPPTFCYCGSGWYRRQWEGAIGRPVKIEIVKSILKGDDVCQFAIHLPQDL
jgi:effector-binding domain-containing protein